MLNVTTNFSRSTKLANKSTHFTSSLYIFGDISMHDLLFYKLLHR